MAALPDSDMEKSVKAEYSEKDVQHQHDVEVVRELEEHGELVTIDHGVADDLAVTTLPPEEERRIVRKIDYHVVPLLTFLYLMSFVDRTNSRYPFSRRLLCVLTK